MKKFQGVSASLGIGIAPAFVLQQDVLVDIPHFTIRTSDLHQMWQGFIDAVEKVQKDLSLLIDNENNEQRAIFSTYTLMLSDPEFISHIKNKFEESLINIEYILHTEVEILTTQLLHSGDRYLSQRANDIKDVFDRVLAYLLGKTRVDIDSIPSGSILIADCLKPSDAALLSKRSLSGLVLEEGGTNSHVAILARSYGIPAVMGVQNIVQSNVHGKTVIVDGTHACVFVDPDKKTCAAYRHVNQIDKKQAVYLSSFKNREARTACGEAITILANIGTNDEVPLVLSEGAKGIGLFRSEFLFMHRDTLLDEEEQFDIYKSVLIDMKDMPVTIRTLDAGADKVIPGQDILSDANPLLGWRAIRFCFDRLDIFKGQLRALLRASEFGSLRIMFPLVCDISEITRLNLLVEEVKAELRSEGKSFNAQVPLGIMVETPAAAVCAALFARKTSFFSIGSNDLTQYTLAIDRENPKVAALYSEFHPAVLTLIKYTIDAAHNAHISVSLCGEMAAQHESALLLLGMGLRTFSLSANSISSLKELLSLFTLDEAKAITDVALKMDSAQVIRAFTAEKINEKRKNLFV